MAAKRAIARTQAWLERAVIGLNLCPFAKAVQVKGQIRYAVSEANTPEELLEDLSKEIKTLQVPVNASYETTLIIATGCLKEFLEFNDFLRLADHALDNMGLQGSLQIASFHPQYQFAGTAADDITNFTNRSPYPTLHLLREASIDRAVAAFPQAADIYEKNMQTLAALGHGGWALLNVGAGDDVAAPVDDKAATEVLALGHPAAIGHGKIGL